MIERIQWTCPICKRRYAIPATAPTPSRCPQCRENERESAAPASLPFSAGHALVEESEESGEEMPESAPLSALAAIQLEVAEEAARGPAPMSPVGRQRGASVKTLEAISLANAVLAGLAIVGSFAGLFYGLRTAFIMAPTPARTVAIFSAIGYLCGGLVAALTFFTVSVLVRLLLQIEENTRVR